MVRKSFIEIGETALFLFLANVDSTLWKFQPYLPAYPPPGDSRWSKFQYQVQIFGQKYYNRRNDRDCFTTRSCWICSRIKINSVLFKIHISFWIFIKCQIFSKMSDLKARQESGDFSDSDSIIVSSFNIYGLTDDLDEKSIILIRVLVDFSYRKSFLRIVKKRKITLTIIYSLLIKNKFRSTISHHFKCKW